MALKCFRNFDYHSVHVAGAERIAKIAAECGVSNFIHVSHLNASKTSPSKFYQTKAQGEELVKAAFPTATIVRPSTMFGYEDKLLNNIAGNHIRCHKFVCEVDLPPNQCGQSGGSLTMHRQKFDPFMLVSLLASHIVYCVEHQSQVLDVAQALTNLLSRSRPSQTIHLPGPSTLTYEYLLDLVSSVTLEPPSRAPVLPQAIARILAKLGQNVWWPTLSPDEVVRRYIDDVDVPGDWNDVGVQPTEIEDTAIAYLRRYRSAYVHGTSFRAD